MAVQMFLAKNRPAYVHFGYDNICVFTGICIASVARTQKFLGNHIIAGRL